MPLILLCGLPCSGKTTICKRVAELIRELKPEYEIEIVSEEEIAASASTAFAVDGNTIDPRIAIYANANLEKQLRAQVKSRVSLTMFDLNNDNIRPVALIAVNYRTNRLLYRLSKRLASEFYHCTREI